MALYPLGSTAKACTPATSAAGPRRMSAIHPRDRTWPEHDFFQGGRNPMASVFASLVPVFLIIATGWLCRITGFVDEKHWVGMERVTYVVFFPALVIDTLARADLASVPVLSVGGALIGSILLMSGGLILARPALQRVLDLDGPSFTSLFQGSTRWNTFVAIAIAGSLFGQRGVTLMAVAIAAMVPLLNVLALYAFVRYAGGPRQS